MACYQHFGAIGNKSLYAKFLENLTILQKNGIITHVKPSKTSVSTTLMGIETCRRAAE